MSFFPLSEPAKARRPESRQIRTATEQPNAIAKTELSESPSSLLSSPLCPSCVSVSWLSSLSLSLSPESWVLSLSLSGREGRGGGGRTR